MNWRSVKKQCLSSFQRADDIRISRIGNGQRAHTEVFTAGSAELNVGAAVVLDLSLGQHGVVLNLRLPAMEKNNCVSDTHLWRSQEQVCCFRHQKESLVIKSIRQGIRNQRNHHGMCENNNVQ